MAAQGQIARAAAPDIREPPALAARAVGKTFRRGRQATHALATIDLDIADGEFVAIVGPSGCGKSTLLRIMAGLLPPSSGSVEVLGEPVDGPATRLGIVFQSPVLLDWRTVLGNVLVQLELRHQDPGRFVDKARNLLGVVGLRDFEDRYPFELSGGMRQRTAIVRALIHDPPVLMMDEPFGALDALTREQMRIDLEELWLQSRKTVLFITHSIDEAVLLADRVAVMTPRPGEIEQMIEIDMPRPRGVDGRKHPRFTGYSDHITELFLQRGVLHRGSLLAQSILGNGHG